MLQGCDKVMESRILQVQFIKEVYSNMGQLLDGDHDKKPHILNITFKGLEFWYWRSRSWPKHPPWSYVQEYCSDGVIMANRHLWDPIDFRRSGWYLPISDDRDPFLCIFFTSSHEIPRTNYVVMVLTSISHPAFAFHSHAQTGFSWIKEDCTIVDPHFSDPSERDHFMRFTNGIWFQENFYALSLHGTLAVIEDIDSHFRTTALSKRRAIPSVSSLRVRESLVESDGEVLLVFLISTKSINIVDYVEVYQLDIAKLEWIKMASLGMRTVFLGSNCCISVSANKVGCSRNCIYFTHRSVDGWWVYDMERGTINPGWPESSSSKKVTLWAEQT